MPDENYFDNPGRAIPAAEPWPEEHFAQLETWVMDTLLAKVVIKREMIDAHSVALAHVIADVQPWGDSLEAALG